MQKGDQDTRAPFDPVVQEVLLGDARSCFGKPLQAVWVDLGDIPCRDACSGEVADFTYGLFDLCRARVGRTLLQPKQMGGGRSFHELQDLVQEAPNLIRERGPEVLKGHAVGAAACLGDMTLQTRNPWAKNATSP